MSNVITLGGKHPLTGTWRSSAPDATVEFWFEKTQDSFNVSAKDLNDGEILDISSIAWNNQVLSFVVTTPSTGWQLVMAVTLVDEETARFSTTIEEDWHRTSQ